MRARYATVHMDVERGGEPVSVRLYGLVDDEGPMLESTTVRSANGTRREVDLTSDELLDANHLLFERAAEQERDGE